MGRGRTEWEKDAENYHLNIKVPFNTEATVFVLAKDADEVMEGGKSAKERKDISFIKMENGYAVFNVFSGEYHFSSSAIN